MEKRVDTKFINPEEVFELTKLATNQTESLIRYKLSSYSEKHIGCLGSHQKLIIETKCNNFPEIIKTHSFFIKTIPYDNPEEATYILEKNVFEQETTFFSKIVPLLIKDVQIRNWAPTCYLAKSDTIVLEDLKNKAYYMRGLIFDKEMTKSALLTIARMHAASILAEKKLSKTFLELYPNNFKEMTFMGFGKNHQWCMSGVNTAIAVADSIGLDSSKISLLYEHLLKLNKQEQKKISKVNDKRPKVICHGDLWSNNIMFNDNEPVDCILVDFQFIRYASPAQDIMLLLYLTTTREFRQKFETEMINFYHAELVEIIRQNNPSLELFSIEDLTIMAEEQRLRAVVSGIIYSSSVTLTKKLAPEVFQDYNEYDKYQYGDRREKVMELMQRDETFKRRVVESVQDIVDFGRKSFII